MEAAIIAIVIKNGIWNEYFIEAAWSYDQIIVKDWNMKKEKSKTRI